MDDEEPNVLLLDRLLRSSGYTSISSTMNPHMVCELYHENRYDLIILDIQMPEMDGFQVMEGLKQIETEGYIPVIVITVEPGHKLRALKAGAKDFISKPFELLEVLTRVHNMLEVRLLHVKMKNYSKVLEQTVLEIEENRELIRYQRDEVKSLYEAELLAKNDAEDARQVLLDEHNLLQQALLPVEMHMTPNYELAT
ncbi:MAG: response regulator, partial [Armatimonadota bacterium]